MTSLQERVALVTGASRGLGKDIALALARAGTAVVVAARTETAGSSQIPGTLADTMRLIEEAGGRALAIRCDVTREDEVGRAVDQTLQHFGRIDILVNNAGILIPGTVLEMSPRHWELAFRVNVTGPFLLCRAAMPHMVGAGGGHVLNISSRGAVGPGAGPYREVLRRGTVYGSTKAALERFSQGLAAELYAARVSVNVLSPSRAIWSEGGHYFRSRTGEPSYTGWRMDGAIMGDAALAIITQEPGRYTGNIRYDEQVMTELGGLTPAEVLERYPIAP